MRISGITYVKRRRKWFSKLLLILLIVIIVAFIVIMGLLMFTDIHIPYISEWLNT